MKQIDMLEELKNLTNTDRFEIIEAALRMIRQDFQSKGNTPDRKERKRHMSAAAKALLPDYNAGGELTIFTNLDSEDFNETG
ncbi:MAG: hypothetical protein ACE5JB_00125 [bacterium]